MLSKSMEKIQFSLSGDDIARLRKAAVDIDQQSVSLVAKTILTRALDRPALLERGELDVVQVNKRLAAVEVQNKKLLEDVARLQLTNNKLLAVLNSIAPVIIETHKKVANGDVQSTGNRVAEERRRTPSNPSHEFGLRSDDDFIGRLKAAIGDDIKANRVIELIRNFRARDENFFASDLFINALAELDLGEAGSEAVQLIIAEDGDRKFNALEAAEHAHQ